MVLFFGFISYLFVSSPPNPLLGTNFNTRKIMKKSLRTLISGLLLAVAGIVPAHADTPITFEQLPATAQQTVKTHFKDRKIALTTKEREGLGWSYEVTFSNGDQIEFDKSGKWTDIDCKRTAVPDALVPTFVKSYVAKNYSGDKVLELSCDRRGYEARLSNRFELEFDTKGRLTGIDD